MFQAGHTVGASVDRASRIGALSNSFPSALSKTLMTSPPSLSFTRYHWFSSAEFVTLSVSAAGAEVSGLTWYTAYPAEGTLARNRTLSPSICASTGRPSGPTTRTYFGAEPGKETVDSTTSSRGMLSEL